MKPRPKNLNKLAAQIHKDNHFWWHNLKTGKPLQRNRCELLMLVVTELAEAVEGIRKNLMDDKLPHRKMEEVELADAVIRLLDFAGGFKIKITISQIALRLKCDNKAEEIFEITNAVTRIQHGDFFRVDQYLSVAIERIMLYCIHYKLDLWGAVAEKRRFNKTRADHKPENRLKKHGKKF